MAGVRKVGYVIVGWMFLIAWIHALDLDQQRFQRDGRIVRFSGIDYRIFRSWWFRRVRISTRKFLLNSYLDPRYSARVGKAKLDTGPY